MLPKIVTRLIRQLKGEGHGDLAAYKIAVAAMIRAGNIKPDLTATPKGVRRGNMTPSQRAKSRAAKASGGKPGDYIYHPKTNSVTKKKRK